MLRLLGLIFASVLVLNAVGTATDAIPRDSRHLSRAIGGIGLAVVVCLESRGNNGR